MDIVKFRSFKLFLLVLLAVQPVHAQFSSTFPGPTPQNPMTPQTPIIPDTPPPRIDIPVIVPNIPPPVLPIVPTDLTQPVESPKPPHLEESPGALNGIQALAEDAFPKDDMLRNPDGIIVKHRKGSKFDFPNESSVRLHSGDILVSVRRPSKFARVFTDMAEASFAADSDVELRLEDGSLRLINLSGLGQKVLVKLADSLIEKGQSKVYSIKPGYELVISEHRLQRRELRPSDGYARRSMKTFENGQIAISEISVESVLKSSDLVADLQQSDSGVKERRILADMSKMAAVLNYVNGTNGYNAESKAALEVKSEIKN